MINIQHVKKELVDLTCKLNGVFKVDGISEKSDSEYYRIYKNYDTDEEQFAYVRLSNHYNHVNTHSALCSAISFNVYDKRDIPDLFKDLRLWLKSLD